jgi:hypothetical protein
MCRYCSCLFCHALALNRLWPQFSMDFKHRNPRMVSSGMLRRVALVITDVSEELSASFIRATRIGELGTTLAEDTILHSHCRENLKSYIEILERFPSKDLRMIVNAPLYSRPRRFGELQRNRAVRNGPVLVV